MIETPRLTLRAWRADDAVAHHDLCRHPSVVATLGAPPRIEHSREVVRRQNAILAQHGYCFWAAEDRATATLIGWCGIKPGRGPIEGHTEIGWTIAPDRWGQGYAREAAQAVVAWTWANTALRSLTAITTPVNARSWGLMERLGMCRCADEDFDHPDLATDDPLRPHIVYRIERPVQLGASIA